jgi:hypothetical protein
MKKEDLKLKLPVYEDNIQLSIETDVNDGDYINSTNILSLERFEKILPIIKKIEDRDDNNWEVKDFYLTEEEIDLISQYIPTMDNEYVHTINYFEVFFLSKNDNIRYEVIY